MGGREARAGAAAVASGAGAAPGGAPTAEQLRVDAAELGAVRPGARVFAAAAPGGVFFTATAADAKARVEKALKAEEERAKEEQANRTVL